VEFVFFCFSIKASLVEILEYFLNMFRHVIQVDEYIVQIDHNTNIQKVREEVIHELLEDCRRLKGITDHLNNL